MLKERSCNLSKYYKSQIKLGKMNYKEYHMAEKNLLK